MTPKPGNFYIYFDKQGRKKESGRVKNIARMPTGAVLAFFENGKGYPITKHGWWVKI